MTQRNGKRVEYLDLLRGIAILLMIIGHIGFGKYVERYIHIFHMPIWFFISGYFFNKKSVPLKVEAGRLGSSLLVPYFFAGLFQYPIWILLQRNDEEILLPLVNLLWHNTEKVMPIAGALWFLPCLFFANLIYRGIVQLVKKEKLIVCISMLVALFGNVYNLIVPYRLPWAIDVSFVAVGFICIGSWVRDHQQDRYVARLFALPISIVWVGFLINAVMGFLNGYVNLRIGMYGIIPLFWINALVAIVIYWNMSRLLYKYHEKNAITQMAARIVCRIGKNSIIYLCFNQLAIVVFNKVIERFLPGGGNSYPGKIAVLFLAISTVYLLDRLISISPLKRIFGIKEVC